MAKKEKKLVVLSEDKNPKEEGIKSLADDGWLETNEVRDNGRIKVYERIVDGVREYKEVVVEE